jgi:EAL domain-containing protein (putative c-di-GMP-specific phosphodiesterase class I)
LKVDRSFVNNVGKLTENSIIVRTILSLARSLNLDAVAEGIETQSQMAFLRATGCRYGQGYYFSKPVGACDAVRLLESPIGQLADLPVVSSVKASSVKASSLNVQ